MKRGYRRIVCGMESIQGGEGDMQAIKIKQLYADFDADYCVLDARNGGILIYDRLARVLYDEERDVEYEPWTCMNDEGASNRIKIEGARPIVFIINASERLNSEIAMEFKSVLENQMIDF